MYVSVQHKVLNLEYIEHSSWLTWRHGGNKVIKSWYLGRHRNFTPGPFYPRGEIKCDMTRRLVDFCPSGRNLLEI